MTRTIAEWTAFALWVCLVATFFAALLMAQGIPLATDIDRARSQVAISLDGSEFTFRKQAPNALRICVEPETFGKKTCLTVGDVRTGRWGLK